MVNLTLRETGATPKGSPLSNAEIDQNFINLKNAVEVDAEPSISTGIISQYFRGDKTWRDFFTDVRATTLTGLSTATNVVISATDTVLAALGKLQAQISAKQDTLISGTSIKTVNSASLLGSGNITTGDVAGQASSVDSEIALFSGAGGKTIKRAATTGMLKANSGVLSAAAARTDYAEPTTALATGLLKNTTTTGAHSIAVAGIDYVAPNTPSTFTATQTFKGITETVYNLAGTAIAISNGTIQYKTLSANTTFTSSLADGQAVTLMINPSTFTVTWPTITWVGGQAPTLTASKYNVFVIWQVASVTYGNFVGVVG